MPELVLTKDQQAALDSLLSFIDKKEERVFILKGYAGTGKTTLVKRIVSELKERKREFILLASTGRAAKVLGDAISGLSQGQEDADAPEAKTIHSLIYTFDRITQDLDLFSQDLTVRHVKNGEIKLKFSLQVLPEYDGDPAVYIVDESSMISDNSDDSFSFAEYGNEGRLLQDLLNYDKKGQFVFIGDNCQLPPVNQGISPALSESYFRDTFELKAQDSELTNIVRQVGGNDIKLSSSRIREKITDPSLCEQDLSFPLQGYQNIHIIPSEYDLIKRYLNDIRDRDFSRATFIVLSNKKVSVLSNRVRTALGFNTSFLEVGDLLLVTQNNMVSRLMNGDLVKVISVGTRENRANLSFVHVQVQSLATEYVYSQLMIEEILYSGMTNISLEQQTALMIDFHKRATKKGLKQGSDMYNEMMRNDSYLNALRCIYGYTLTCHKAQGGEWDNVYLEIPRMFYYNDHKFAYQWVYTAMTRAKKDLYVLNDFWIK